MVGALLARSKVFLKVPIIFMILLESGFLLLLAIAPNLEIASLFVFSSCCFGVLFQTIGLKQLSLSVGKERIYLANGAIFTVSFLGMSIGAGLVTGILTFLNYELVLVVFGGISLGIVVLGGVIGNSKWNPEKEILITGTKNVTKSDHAVAEEEGEFLFREEF